MILFLFARQSYRLSVFAVNFVKACSRVFFQFGRIIMTSTDGGNKVALDVQVSLHRPLIKTLLCNVRARKE